jgi:hypothetical protein
MSRKPIEDEELPKEVMLMRIVNLRQAAELAGLNERTLAKFHADKVIRLSPGRVGMRVRDALMIAESKKKEEAP